MDLNEALAHDEIPEYDAEQEAFLEWISTHEFDDFGSTIEAEAIADHIRFLHNITKG